MAVAGFAMMNVMLLVDFRSGPGRHDATRDIVRTLISAVSRFRGDYSGQPFFPTTHGRRFARWAIELDVRSSLAIFAGGGQCPLYETPSTAVEHAFSDAALSLTFFLLIGRYNGSPHRALQRDLPRGV